MSDYLQIKYRNSCDLAGSVFQQVNTPFYYVFYLGKGADVGKPVIEIIEEGREDGEKNFIPDFRKQVKNYNFTTVVPEYQLDALCSIMLHDTIYIRLKNDERSRVYNFKVTPGEWTEGGEMITVTVSFTINYELATGCCNNEKIVYQPCYVCNSRITPSDWVDINTQQTTQYTDRAWLMMGLPDLASGEFMLNRLYQYRYTTPNVISRGGGVVAPVGGYAEYIGRGSELICFTHDGVAVRFYYLNGYWRPAGFIRDRVLSGGKVTVRAWMYPNTFAQLYQSFNGVNYTAVGSPVFGGTMQQVGVQTASLTPGLTWYFKVHIYDNNCDYGYTNVVSVTT